LNFKHVYVLFLLWFFFNLIFNSWDIKLYRLWFLGFNLFVDHFDIWVGEISGNLICHRLFPLLFYTLHVNDDKDLSLFAIFPLEFLFLLFFYLRFFFFGELLQS
jgi:hypothetical protein